MPNIIKKKSNKLFLTFQKRKKLPFDYNLIQKIDDSKNNQKLEHTINESVEQKQNMEINNQEIQINNNEIPQQNNQDEQQEEPYKLINKFESNQVRLQKTINIIKELQNRSSNKRIMEESQKYYLREIGDFNTLCKHYSIKKINNKQNLKQHCNKIQFVRGDGNCFYTAFIYQFFIHLLFTYNLNQYDQFIQFVLDKKIQFKINYEDFQIDDQELLEEFLYQLQQLRLIENEEDRKQQLLSQFIQYFISEDGKGCFYNLSSIFLRNLCDTILELSEMKDQCLDRENLLIWEAECNYNEIIVQILAQQLKIHIKLIFFQNGEFIIQEYEKDCQNQIILLIQPGHYNIGYND
ncbi:unnamed protein product [Paramecium pentaurelia]|uniref:OTU domain-containing protein n=1 Tax=Paramecium pentaurelia TaxID=43138 RepID=A0A8S1X913_9CILI|nr:unnamed protein product [Paramecium pentaurelia]